MSTAYRTKIEEKLDDIAKAIRQSSGEYDLTDYKSITAAVRNGDGEKIPNGTVFTVPHEVYGDIDFIVRRKNVDKVVGEPDRPTMTIQVKNLLSKNGSSSALTLPFDERNAFASISEEIPAGTVVKFTMIKYNKWDAGNYHFTATEKISAGNKLLFSGIGSTDLTQLNVLVFKDAKATEAIAQYAIESGDGNATVNLGTLGTELVHPHRASYGSNNAAECILHQFLNGIGLMPDIYEAKTIFSMFHSSYASLYGFLGGFPEEFRACLGLCSIHNITNTVYESSNYEKNSDYTYNGYFWLPSRKELYGTNENSNEESESQFPYYANVGTTNADKLMRAKGATNAVTYWLRTPNAGGAIYVRVCNAADGGALNHFNATLSYGVAPLAILA